MLPKIHTPTCGSPCRGWPDGTGSLTSFSIADKHLKGSNTVGHSVIMGADNATNDVGERLRAVRNLSNSLDDVVNNITGKPALLTVDLERVCGSP